MSVSTEVIGEATSQPATPTRISVCAATILAAHMAVDVYGAIVPAILGILEVRCELRPEQTAWLLGVGSLSSGVSQPICAWLSDRFDTRVFGALGLGLGAMCLSLIGDAHNFATLLPLYIAGMFGVGMFHPIAASSMGQLGHRRRSAAVSAFFVAGMVGGVFGAWFSPRLIAHSGGFESLRWVMIPGLAMAVAFQRSIGPLPHRHATHRERKVRTTDAGARWATILLLFVAAVLRFTVNMALWYLYVRWAQEQIAAANRGLPVDEVARLAAPYSGNFIALSMAGMLVGGLLSGFLVRQGREKLPMVFVPICFAPCILLFGHVSLHAGYLLCLIVGIGFASMIPVSIALAQRLLPHRTSLASGLMMGGAWSIATVGPRLAEFGVSLVGLPTTFAVTAVALVLSGIVVIPIRSSLISAESTSFVTESDACSRGE